MARESKNWKAIESTDFGGGNRTINVTGDVQTFKSNEKLSLTRAEPQGINPQILLLNLTVSGEGIGSDVLGWQHVEYSEAIAPHQFTDVTIQGDIDAITVKVEEVIS